MKRPLISVIVPLYNVEDYIVRNITSIKGQVFFDFEVIYVDNNSKDNSYKIIEKFSKLDPRIKLFSFTEKQGASATRNYALSKAQGEYVVFIDADDWVNSHYLQNLINTITKKNVDMAISACLSYNQKNNISYDDKYHSGVLFDHFGTTLSSNDIIENLNTFPAISCCKIFKTKIIKDNTIKFKEDLIFEDVVFCLEYILACKNFTAHYIQEYDYNYTRNISSVTNNHNNHENIFLMLEKIEQLFKKYNIYDRYKFVFYQYRINSLLLWLKGEYCRISYFSYFKKLSAVYNDKYYKLFIKDMGLSENKHKFLNKLIKNPRKSYYLYYLKYNNNVNKYLKKAGRLTLMFPIYFSLYLFYSLINILQLIFRRK